MINCKIAICADSVIVDTSTNNVTIFNLIEEMKSHGFPLLITKLAYLFYMTRGKSNKEIHKGSLVLALDREKLNNFPVQIDFKGKLKTRVILRLSGLVIPKPGTLSATLILRGKEYGRWDIEVKQIGPKLDESQG